MPIPSTAEGARAILTSPAAAMGLLAAGLWAPAAGAPTWPALARGPSASTLEVGAAVKFGVFILACALGAAERG